MGAHQAAESRDIPADAIRLPQGDTMTYGLYKCPTCSGMGSDNHECGDDSCSGRYPLELIPLDVGLGEWIALFPEYVCRCCSNWLELDTPLMAAAG